MPPVSYKELFVCGTLSALVSVTLVPTFETQQMNSNVPCVSIKLVNTEIVADESTQNYFNYSELSNCMYSDIEKIEIINKFATNLLGSMEDMNPKYAEELEKSFWDLM
ncbi:MAG: hypothetical protein COB02_09065 [Candidatus Cloacimonadota bacterium]|nr:MAG: hypothetical protein COB02_09065 [Candidatus Cloacimonadota bacterium]